MNYAIVTPARNERENLGRLAQSLAAQTMLPDAWIIVDDGSDDGTDALAAELAATHAWISLESSGRRGGALANGRREARELVSFRTGVQRLPRPVDIVVKVDADTSYEHEPDYFERLVGAFATHSDLGIAGGACYELEDGAWVRQRVTRTHPRGASRAYRWDCLDSVMTLDARMGWDGLDEARAALQGYRSETLIDLSFRHHRKVGGRERSAFQHGTAQGRASWYMGYRPSYLVLRTLYRMPRDPALVGMIVGYAAAAIEREPRHAEPEVVRHVRSTQRLGAIMRRGMLP
jgi:biofilm PGA synthesis N-glycosyltransferase PgaC